jgi:hypothetical protein
MAKPRPFDQEIADEVCDRITDGESLRKITLDEHMPSPVTIYKWLNENADFVKQSGCCVAVSSRTASGTA